MRNSEITLLLAHAYVFGAWFQNTFLLKLGMLFMALLFIFFSVIASRNEFQLKMLEKRMKLRKRGK